MVILSTDSSKISQITPSSINIFNDCLWFGHCSPCWKVGKVIALPKPFKNPSIPSNNRPFSLLSAVGKLFEKTILKSFLAEVYSEDDIPIQNESKLELFANDAELLASIKNKPGKTTWCWCWSRGALENWASAKARQLTLFCLKNRIFELSWHQFNKLQIIHDHGSESMTFLYFSPPWTLPSMFSFVMRLSMSALRVFWDSSGFFGAPNNLAFRELRERTERESKC